MHQRLTILLIVLFIMALILKVSYFQNENIVLISVHQVDIKNDSERELALLPGVGPRMAQKIILMRTVQKPSIEILKDAGVSVVNIEKIVTKDLIKKD